ncbi:hypothetical protein ABI011_14970, partial [Enterococcus faecium]|uniref:hypothetical protein n=1 Tax=Enterococcus faecium TaxID=1352 RepID=UPI003F43151F
LVLDLWGDCIALVIVEHIVRFLQCDLGIAYPIGGIYNRNGFILAGMAQPIFILEGAGVD